MTTALILVAALLVLTVGVGAALRLRDGRSRAERADAPRVRAEDLSPAPLAPRATLVQFSTEMCARCPQVRRELGAWASEREGVEHLDIDLTARRDLAVRYGILSTPTTLVVDRDGVVRSRFHGVPRAHALEAALAEIPAPALA